MSSKPASAPLPTFEQARQIVEDHAAKLHPRGKELLELVDATGRILAEPVVADRNFPPFPRATRDGYAVKIADLAKVPCQLKVVGEIKAGVAAGDLPTLAAGEAAAIMTGAPAPPGADAVVMVEYTSREGDQVKISRAALAGDNIVPAGEEAKRGESLLTSGTRFDYSAISVAASVGRSRILVYAKPHVAVLSTGDEIVDINALPGPYQIRNSNSFSLGAQVLAAGGEPVLLPIAPDEPVRLRDLIRDGLEADLLLITGGVSMGKFDLVEDVLASFQAEFFFTGAEIQPGRPVVFGRAPKRPDGESEAGVSNGFTYFFGLPGNPVSTMVCFELFARPVVEALTGMPPRKPIFLNAKLKTEIKTKPGLKRFLPAVLSGEFEQAEVELARWQGSGDIAATARANCYVVVPPERDRILAGEAVSVLLK